MSVVGRALRVVDLRTGEEHDLAAPLAVAEEGGAPLALTPLSVEVTFLTPRAEPLALLLGLDLYEASLLAEPWIERGTE